MADDLSLLFRLRADNTQAKAVLADTRASIAQLRQSFGPQLTQTLTVANKSFADIGNSLQNFVAQRVPLVGGAIVRVTEGLRGFGSDGAKAEKAIASVAKSIESVATQSGKSVPQIASFLSKFILIEGQAKRDKAAVDFFGASLGTKLIPELEKTGTALAAVSAESATAGSSIAAMAGPIGIAVLALAALAAGAVIAAREIFQLTKNAAEFQGKMFDLAQQTGLAVETLSALEVVAKTTGGNLGTITQAVVLFQRKLDEAQDPLGKTAELFRKFNIDTSDTETSLRSAFTALARMPEGFAQTNAAAELFGARGGKQVLAILKEANGDIDGTIKRLREMGILISEDAARAADKLNDDLALSQLQLRALTAVAAEDLIPVIAELIRATGNLITAIRPLVSLLGSLTAFGLRPVVKVFKDVSIAIRVLTGDYQALAKAIKEAREEQEIKPLKVPDLKPTELPGQPSAQQSAADAINLADAVIAGVKRSVATQNQVLDELFQKGRRTREQQANETIAANKRILDADKQRIDALLAQKELEIKALDEAQKNRGEIANRDTEQFRAITAEIGKLQQERLDKEALFEVTAREIRARAAKERADSQRNQIRNTSDLEANEFDRQIKNIEGQIRLRVTTEENGLKLIQDLEQAKINVRIESVQKQRDVGFLTLEDQKDLNNELQKLNQEKVRLTDEQNTARLERIRIAQQREIDIATAHIDTLLQLEQIAGQRRIDTLQSLADARVIAEEEASQRILRIRLGLIDDEIEATKSKITGTETIADNDNRLRAQAELNNQLKILNEERKSIQEAGNRDIDEARRKDIDNERRYAEDLREVKERIRRIERDAAEEIVRLMVIHFASRRDIIRAQVRLDVEQERERHRQAEETLRELEKENRESNKTQEEKLEFEKDLNLLREAEAERHQLAMQGIKDQAKQDEEEATPLGRLGLDIENLKEFASVIEDSIVPLGEILTRTFQQVADAIGQTVANWVLLGETGPAVMRKILAQALASIAAEAAVNAIKELALGFATLFFNPAESAAHFTAAGLWASIGVGSALAGRAVAGDLFKSKTGAGGGGSSDGRSGELSPLNLARNAGPGSQPQIAPQIQPIKLIIEHRVNDSKFAKAITSTVVEDINNAGPIREVINGDGNLNRG